MTVDYEEGRRLLARHAMYNVRKTEQDLADWLLLNADDILASPAEDEVEAVARAICLQEYGDPDGFSAITLADTERTTPRWHYCKGSARAAIAALRDDRLRMDGELYDVPERTAPKLSEEERARVEEARARRNDILGKEWQPINSLEAHCDRAFLLSLIDKLTEVG